jgi:hypothetical protein
VREGDKALKAKLDDILVQKRSEISALLERYGIPTLPLPMKASQNETPAPQK